MGKFSCIIHPLDIELFSTFEPQIKQKRPGLIRKLFEWSMPLTISEITGLESLSGKKAPGSLILYNILPDQLLSLDSGFLLKKLIYAGKLAEDFGANIFGLAAYTAQVGKHGSLVAKNLRIPVTTGTSYTIIVVAESIFKAARELGMDFDNVTVAIVGATGRIGSITAHILSSHFPNMILVGRHKQKLEDLSVALKESSRSLNISISDDVNASIRRADIILVATNTPYKLLDVNDLQPGSLVCDVSLPKNVTQEHAESRDDILVIDGGIVKPPGNIDFNFNYGLPPGLCYACMAETMILALEEAYELCSVGGNVDLEKARAVGMLAGKHGFKLAEFRSFGTLVSNERIKKVVEAFKERKRLAHI